jgi:cob(I)alamin adenosyltransferase
MPGKVDKSPRKHKGVKNFVKRGLIIVHTGNGKGKSTAAFGTAIRALGRNYKVAIIQFIKGNWKTGEGQFFGKFKGQCEIMSMGDGFTWETQNFKEDVKTAERTWEKCREVLHDKKYHLVIFDEINYVMKYNFLDVDEIVGALQDKPADKHVILTGNGAPRKLIKIADLVTEMKCIKHPYDQGIKAQPGIDY